ncbi:MAG: 16S rRNA (cytosine(1402)-N(4))-methyltransferase RsmH, partial [Chloroflexota bacterium]
MDTVNTHVPVLYQEVLALLQPRPGGRFIDGTVGAGGHAAGLLQASAPDGRLLALDRDAEALAFARQTLAAYGQRATFVQASFAEMGLLAAEHGFGAVDGILLDLGLSSRQLDQPARGFSFRQDGPLDMRFDTRQAATAADLVNDLSEAELADVLWRYGEVENSHPVARAIVAARPLTTTSQLAQVVAGVGRAGRRSHLHPATRVFQALRIVTNQELQALEEGLPAAMGLLKPGGRLAVISFHSLEDRLVKNT